VNDQPIREGRAAHWLRVLRPLSWWFLLVLVLYAIRLHQRLSEQTNVQFTTSVPGQPFFPDATAQLDGQPFSSGQRVAIGWHELAVTHPKGIPFSTNLFVWYGERNLGKIILVRTKGTLAISATPVAQRLSIRGPEFNVTLTNSEGFNAPVPTDRYVVEATYQYWQGCEAVTVSTDATSGHRFAPRFGTLIIAASHPDISFELRKGDGTPVKSGLLPVTIPSLPESSDYQLQALRKWNRQDLAVAVNGDMTNTFKVQFVYGMLTIESEPAGATVLKDGKELGITPLTLLEANPGPFEFSLLLDEYETSTGKLAVTANQTNIFRATLISQHFTQAMNAARQYYASTEYDRAAQAAVEALKFKPGDGDVANLLYEATMMGHLAKAETFSAQSEFTNAITEANLALALAPDNTRAKELVADCTNREQKHLEAIRKREAKLAEQARQQHERELAEQQTQQRAQELREAFNEANRPYENSSHFSNHEMVTSNSVNAVGNAISSALSGEQPAFENARLNWIYPHLFMLEARQRVGIGYRDCLILGSQVRDNEVQIRFKVFEYEHSPDLKLLGGMLQLSTAVNITSQDSKVADDDARRFQHRIREGINLVTAKIQRAIFK